VSRTPGNGTTLVGVKQSALWKCHPIRVPQKKVSGSIRSMTQEKTIEFVMTE
jgi:hypothetical protein